MATWMEKARNVKVKVEEVRIQKRLSDQSLCLLVVEEQSSGKSFLFLFLFLFFVEDRKTKEKK